MKSNFKIYCYTYSIFQVNIDNFINEPLPRKFQMVSFNTEKVKSSGLIKCLESNSVFCVDGRLPQGLNNISLTRVVKLKMSRLSRFHHAVLVMLDQDKVFQLRKVDGIRSILLSFLIVDLSNEETLLYICVKVKGIMPILSLDQEVLDKLHICAIVEKITNNVTEGVHLTRTIREAKDTLMLSSKCDQVLHRRIRTSLSNSSQELS